MRQIAAKIRQAPALHRPRLVLSDHVRGSSPLDKIADAANQILAIVGAQRAPA